MKKDVMPLKKSLRGFYEAKQQCDDTTVHIQVSTSKTLASVIVMIIKRKLLNDKI